MRSIFKKILLVVSSLIVVFTMVILAAIFIDHLQVSKDFSTLRSLVEKRPGILLSAKKEEPIQWHVTCRPASSAVTYCPALLYKIDESECITALGLLSIKKEWCAHSAHIEFYGRPIEVRFGQSYEMDDGRYYLQFIMNEPNLLSRARF